MYKKKNVNESNQSWTVCSCIAFAPTWAIWQTLKCEIIMINLKNDCKNLHLGGHTNWNVTFLRLLIDSINNLLFFTRLLTFFKINFFPLHWVAYLKHRSSNHLRHRHHNKIVFPLCSERQRINFKCDDLVWQNLPQENAVGSSCTNPAIFIV